MGKGSTPRPIPDREQYARNWDAIRWGTLDEAYCGESDSELEPAGKHQCLECELSDRKYT
jgi:hypothetical protein